MGIKGLHKALSFCTVKDNLDNYRGQRLAIDTSSWLHKSVYSFSEKYVETTDRGHIDPDCVRRSSTYLHKRCQEILGQHQVAKIYLVLDGKRCPLKADESQDREQKRQQNLQEARKYKAQGNRKMAEEKYKGCIRIKNNFTEAVMNSFEKHLCGEGRVAMVQAPYEADAQLVKLCIDNQADAIVTEDSDVLVYSAAAHVACPVLFKLDRSSGSCQRVSMDFLLSMSPEEAGKATKTNNKVESTIRNLASRQGRRKGFGVRLFVQACILCGCDYISNELDGVGLVGAFKLVRENAFRNDNVRFRKILESLPKKVKQKINIDEYEERLAKSEAVFFYHLVKYLGGEVKPLLVPRMSSEENAQEHHHTDHYPFMKRFEQDWSFLGDEATALVRDDFKNRASATSEQFDFSDALRDATAKKSSFFDKPLLSKRPPTGPIHNPYKKSKTSTVSVRVPLEERNGNSFTATSRVTEETPKPTRDELDMIKYLEEIPDPRYVKRKFPTKQKISRPSAGSDGAFRRSEPTHQESKTVARRAGSNLFADFHYVNSPVVQGSSSDVKPQSRETDASAVCDLQPRDADGTAIKERTFHRATPSTGNARTDQRPVIAVPNSHIDLTGNEDDEVIERSSRYFKKTNDPRRVTLGDSDVMPTLRRQNNPPLVQSTDRSESPLEQQWDSDDAIDSPTKQPSNGHARSAFPRNDPYASSVRRHEEPKPKAGGPLLAGLQRQQQFFGHAKQSNKRIFAYSSATKTKTTKMKSLTAYFPSPNKTEAERPHFSQLALNTNQSDDDFLWNG